MYEDDTPPEERRAQALSLDRELLRELMGIEELRELLDAGAIEDVERSLLRAPRNADELDDLLRRAGPLVGGEYDLGFAETLVRERRAIRVRLGQIELFAAVEDAGLVRDAFGAVPPGGIPQVFLEPVESALRAVCRRFAKTRGPFTTAALADRFGLERALVDAELEVLERADELVRGELRPGGSEREWCDPDVLRRIRRATPPSSGVRSSPSSRRRSVAFFLPGMASGVARRCGRRSSRSKGSPFPSRSGKPTCSRGGFPDTGPPTSTRCVLLARSCGSARGSTASPSTSVRTYRSSAARPGSRRPRSVPTRRFALRSAKGRSSGRICSSEAVWTPRRPCRPCGTSSGPERSRTTPGHRFGQRGVTTPPARTDALGASSARV
jgi:hypothetical protein